jgi:Domain of unknown function (DUF4258)
MGNGSTTTAPAARRLGSAQRWFFTMHALQRMDERGVLRSEVLTALDEPEVEYPAHGGRRMAERGGLAVVRADDVVVTVLRRTTEIHYWADSTAQPSFFASRSGGLSWPAPLPTPGRRCDEQAA